MGRFHEILTSPSLPLVVCTFLRTSSIIGITKTIGIYLEDINISLGTTSTDLGIALGLLNAFCHFPAPIIAALYRHHSTRRLILISGTCLPPIGVALTSMAISNAQMSIYLSITGLGFCMVNICCNMTLHRVAKENYNLLFSLGFTGTGVGMVLFPLLAEFLSEAYDWRGGLLIISVLMAHIIPVGMAIKSKSDESSTQRNGFQSVPSSPEGEECNTSTSQDITAPIIAALYRHHSTRRLLLISGTCLPPMGVALISMATSNAQMTIYLSIAGLGNCMLSTCCTMILHRVAQENYNLLYSFGVTGSGAGMVLLPLIAEFLRQAYGWRGGLLIISALMANIIPIGMAIKFDSHENSRQRNGFQGVSSSPQRCNEGTESNGSTSQDTKGDTSDEIGVVRTIANSLRQSDFYMDPVFNVVFGVTFAFGMVFSGWHSFLVPHALQRGISVRSTIIITFAAAIGNIFSRVAVGFLTNILVKPVTLFLFATILNIAAILCDVYFDNYYAMLVTSCISAMSIGGRSVLHQLVVRDRASPEKFDVAYAVNQLSVGLGLFLGGYLCGMIADHFSSYDATFKLLAFIDVIVLLLMVVVRCRPKSNPV